MALWKRESQLDEAGRPLLKETEPESLRINRPTVIFLTGFLTLDRDKGSIAGAIKRLEDMLGQQPGAEEGPQLLAWSHKGLRNLFNMLAYNFMPRNFASKRIQSLTKCVFKPLITDSDGAPIDIEQAKQNLRNLTLFGYSAGTIVAQEMYNAAFRLAKNCGYTPSEAREMLHEVALVSVGNMSRPTKETGRFTTLYLTGTNDRLSNLRNNLWPSFREWLIQFKKKLTIVKMSSTSVYVTAPIKPELWEERELKDGRKIRQKIEALFPRWMPFNSYHELSHFTTHDDTQSNFARMAVYALHNAVRRTSAIDPMDLIEPVELPLLAAANDDAQPLADTPDYKTRLGNAVSRSAKLFRL